MKFLGIDYGTKRVGLSTSSEDGNFAFPKTVLKNTKSLIEDIKRICVEESVTGIVIGESRDLDGKPNPLMKDITTFMEQLKEEIGIPMYLEPEFLTSHQAQKIQGKNDMLDASAAAIILQSFLDKEKNKRQSQIQ